MSVQKIITNFLPTLLFAIISQIVQAQPGSNLPAEQVEVIKIFEAQLAESEKIAVNPELPPADTSIKKQSYEVPPKSITVEYPAPRIRPITYKSNEEIPEVYKAFLKLGGGLPKSIYGEGAFNTLVKRSEKSAYALGLNLFHHSADFSEANGIENQKFALTKGELKGTYYFDQGYAASARMGYTSDKVHYYGYSVDPLSQYENLSDEAVKRLYSTFDLGLNFFNGVQTAGDLNYKAGLDFYTLGDNYAASEQGFDLKGEITKWIAEKHSVDVSLRTDFTWYNDTLEIAQSLHNYTLGAAFTYHADALKVKAGGRIVSSDDEFHLFPDIEAVFNLTGNELAIYAGVEGNLLKNNFRSLSDYNPYIHTRLPDDVLRNTKYYRGYAGFKGNLKYFDYTVEVSYKPTNDLALYKARFEDEPRYAFDIAYDNVNIININGSIKAEPLRGLEITGTLSQNFFDMEVQEKPWHLPSLEANLQALYTAKDGKLKTKATLFLENGVPTNTSFIPGKFDSLNGLFDLSLGAEYWFVKHFGAFIDLNNLFNNKRERWLNYPTYGINVLGGITARF
jgi:hypothetical protein